MRSLTAVVPFCSLSALMVFLSACGVSSLGGGNEAVGGSGGSAAECTGGDGSGGYETGGVGGAGGYQSGAGGYETSGAGGQPATCDTPSPAGCKETGCPPGKQCVDEGCTP